MAINFLEIPGHTSLKDFDKLYEICELAPKSGYLLELGTLFGKSAVFFAETFKKLNKDYKIYCLDYYPINQKNFLEYDKLFGNLDLLKPLEETHTVFDLAKDFTKDYNIEIIKTNIFQHIPKVLRNQNFSVVFEDSAHTYESTIYCLNTYYPKLDKNGIYCGDDFNANQVKKAVREFATQNSLEIITNNKIWYFNVHT